jgi:hypothetical protein
MYHLKWCLISLKMRVSLMSYDVPKMINDQGGQIRIFMPRYGNKRERIDIN